MLRTSLSLSVGKPRRRAIASLLIAIRLRVASGSGGGGGSGVCEGIGCICEGIIGESEALPQMNEGANSSRAKRVADCQGGSRR